MELKSKTQGDIESINNITGFQLPYKFKIYGLVVFIVSMISSILLEIYLEEYKYNDLIKRIAISTAIVGLLIISISKEKIEDELILKLRMQSYNYAVLGAVIVYLTMPFINLAIVASFSSIPKMDGSKDVAVLGLLLTIQILAFRKLKKAYSEE
ncbi:hypothetical protein ACFX5E_06145 [Flavobacterium sp. LS2P90]|uniref:Uncharacterized protein n=1 Tax=Flavobacterium xylosi TaxID=3230415 RepID=A0ABW6HUH9_9FLAO